MSEKTGFAKVDEEKRLVLGAASVAVKADGSQVEDLQGDVIDPGDLEDAFYGFMSKSRAGRTMHQKRNTAEIVGGLPITPETLPAILKAAGIEIKDGKVDIAAYKGAAIVAVAKVRDDETWARVQSGELRAFSIGGRAHREEAA